MPVKKIKVSQLKAATTLVGLWTLGVDATNKSVKVSLEFIKQAYDDVATIKKNAETATGNANTQADRAKEQADNPPKMGDNGNWWQWDDTLKKYVDTGVLAKGGVIYPTFSIEEEDMVLYMSFEDEVSPQLIKFDETTGELFLNVG